MPPSPLPGGWTMSTPRVVKGDNVTGGEETAQGRGHVTNTLYSPAITYRCQCCVLPQAVFIALINTQAHLIGHFTFIVFQAS